MQGSFSQHRSHCPIGVFDSGIGGISVLRALRQTLPNEHFLYYADSAHAPYGKHSKAFIQKRSEQVAQVLVHQHNIKALVIACNTATAAAADALRVQHPNLPIIGVEPGLKPAALASKTKHVAVLATQSTLNSKRFHKLLRALAASHRVRFHLVAGIGLVDAIEAFGNTQQFCLESRVASQKTEQLTQHIQNLCAGYVAKLPSFGHAAGQIDHLVLGCTHYIWAQQALQKAIAKSTNQPRQTADIAIVHTADPVARQTQRVLSGIQLLNRQPMRGMVRFIGSGSPTDLHNSANHWLHRTIRTTQSHF